MRSFFEPLENRRLMAATASIVGTVFQDANSNGRRDSGENGIAKVTVYLDTNNNSHLDGGEKSAVTTAAGAFGFSNLNAGNFIVRQIVPAGMKQTTPQRNYGVHVQLKTGQKSAGNLLGDFGSVASAAPAWSGYAGNPQHTALAPAASQDLKRRKWHVSVDLDPQYSGDELLIHYGSPVITAKNTVIVPVKTGATEGFRIEAHRGSDGSLLWKQTTDYILPPSQWVPEFQPALTSTERVYFAGAGGTVYWRDNVDSASGASGQIAFYGLNKYQANKKVLNDTVFIDTPITADSAGNIYFGIQVTGSNPLNLKGGLVRIAADGSTAYVAASDATKDASIDKVAQNCAPALSNDGKIVYVGMNMTIGDIAPIEAHAYLVALDSKTLKTLNAVRLVDPADGQKVGTIDISSAAPTVGPDGDVYYGIENRFSENHGRGFLLHFSGDLKKQKITGAFGWDDTPSIVPASMVASYRGKSSYLLMVKYNDYAGIGGSGINKIAILDPNASQNDPTAAIPVMKEVLTKAGVTPDPDYVQEYPGAVREWCINSAVVDPATDSVLVNNEDGTLYRWNLGSNSLSQKIVLTGGLGEAYTPTVVGPDGTVYAINRATLWAIGV